MKYIKIVLLVFFVIPVTFGCAAKSMISESKQANIVTYTHNVSGQHVTVKVGEPYEYSEFIERKFEGVLVKGYLFKNTDKNSSAILVTKMLRGDFEKLVGVILDAPMTGIKAYPPKTIFEAPFCELVRAYVVTLDKEVIAVIKVKSLNSDKKACDTWLDLNDVMVNNPEVVTEFDSNADKTIMMSWE